MGYLAEGGKWKEHTPSHKGPWRSSSVPLPKGRRSLAPPTPSRCPLPPVSRRWSPPNPGWERVVIPGTSFPGAAFLCSLASPLCPLPQAVEPSPSPAFSKDPSSPVMGWGPQSRASGVRMWDTVFLPPAMPPSQVSGRLGPGEWVGQALKVCGCVGGRIALEGAKQARPAQRLLGWLEPLSLVSYLRPSLCTLPSWQLGVNQQENGRGHRGRAQARREGRVQMHPTVTSPAGPPQYQVSLDRNLTSGPPATPSRGPHPSLVPHWLRGSPHLKQQPQPHPDFSSVQAFS